MTEEDVKSAESMGKALSNLSLYLGAIANYAGVVLGVLNWEPTGMFMNLTRMTKLICRLRFLDINFGLFLDSFFDWSADKYDPWRERSQELVVERSEGYKGKFTEKKFALYIFENYFLITLVYMISWSLKLCSVIIINSSKRKMCISKIACYAVAFQQRVHISVFNIFSIDLILYGLRTVFHLTGGWELENLISMLLLSFLWYDFTEVWVKGNQAKIIDE